MNQKPPANLPFLFFRTITACAAAALLALVCEPEARAAEAPAPPTPATPAAPAAAAAFVLATDYAPADGVNDAADALQRCIDENPHRTIYLPDGEYLLSHPIATPADPARAVSLRLADFAFLVAAPDWAHESAMVRLGGIHPANNNRAPGSVWGLYGGNLDGAGRATGISIESGRETRVQNVAIKRYHVGIHVMKGANSGSADCDIRDIDMTDNNSYVRCYSDQFSTGWLFGAKSDNADLDGCFVYWWDSNPGKRHTAMRCEGPFKALVDDLWAGFRDTKATNAVLLVGEAGGHGVIRDLRVREERLNAPEDAFRAHFTGRLHP